MLYFSVLFKGHTGTCKKKHVTVFRIKLPNQRVVLSFKVIFQSIIEKKKWLVIIPSFLLHFIEESSEIRFDPHGVLNQNDNKTHHP